MCTPGALVNTGSLGQALSKVLGYACSASKTLQEKQQKQRELPQVHAEQQQHTFEDITPQLARKEVFVVVLGDGELQEGQVFEALQTLSMKRCSNVIVVVDLNGYQTEDAVSSIKAIADYEKLFSAFGCTVRCVDGHSTVELLALFQELLDFSGLDAAGTPQTNALCKEKEVLDEAAGNETGLTKQEVERGSECESLRSNTTEQGIPTNAPAVVLMRTQKGGGSQFTKPEGSKQFWHGRIPSWLLYTKIVDEQLSLVHPSLQRGTFLRFSYSIAVSFFVFSNFFLSCLFLLCVCVCVCV